MKFAFNKIKRDELNRCLAAKDDAALFKLASTTMPLEARGKAVYAAWDEMSRNKKLLVPVASVGSDVYWHGKNTLIAEIAQSGPLPLDENGEISYYIQCLPEPTEIVVEISHDDVIFQNERLTVVGILRMSCMVKTSVGDVCMSAFFKITDRGMASLRGALGAHLHRALQD